MIPLPQLLLLLQSPGLNASFLTRITSVQAYIARGQSYPFSSNDMSPGLMLFWLNELRLFTLCFAKMADSDCSCVRSAEFKSRRMGVVHKEEYKRENIRKAKVKGLQRINYQGRNVPAMQQGDDCKCKKQCFNKISEAERIGVFNKVYAFNKKNEQDLYLQSLIEIQDIKRKRPRNEDPKERSSNFTYNVSVFNRRVAVCKKAYVSLHGITENRVRRLCNLILKGEAPIDKRGKHPCPRRMSAETCQLVREHIESFPLKEACCSSHVHKYLDARLDVRQMHGLFQEKYPSANVSYKCYLKFFKENFSLAFGKPKTDICYVEKQPSQKLKSLHLSDKAKQVAAAELMVHRRSRNFYTAMKNVKKKCSNSDDIIGLTLDYVQDVPLSDIPIQEMFYYRHLQVFNFCVHNLKTGKSVFYSYHAGEGKKDPDTGSSFLLDYISNHVPERVKELYLFSDNYSSQNGNHTVVRFLAALTASKRFHKIVHYFPL